jgi:alanyl-tRNA synthetase
MDDKLYWKDAYKFEFEAEIIDRIVMDDRIGIVLDGTYFYPEGGGQPSDRGKVNDYSLIDVKEDDNERIVHFISLNNAPQENLSIGKKVKCILDTEYRMQNMRAHTGAHMLFGAARKLFAKLEYAGFDIHGGGGSLYLRTDTTITPKLAQKMLELANYKIVDNKAINTYFVKPNDVAKIPGCVYNVALPKGDTRIVEIDGWDVAVCSGTHLNRTIEIGPLWIVNREAHKKGVVRLDYTVGKSAVSELIHNEQILGETSVTLNSSRDDLAKTAQKLVGSLADEVKSQNKLQESLGAYKMKELMIAGNEIVGGITLVVGAITNVNQDIIRQLLIGHIKSKEKIILAVVGRLEKTFIVAGCSNDINLNIHEIVLAIAKRYGGSGGGKTSMVFAGGIESQIENVLNDLQSEMRRLLTNRVT